MSAVLLYLHNHPLEVAAAWPIVTAAVSLGYHKAEASPRLHGLLSAMVAAGVDLPSLGAALKKLITGKIEAAK